MSFKRPLPSKQNTFKTTAPMGFGTLTQKPLSEFIKCSHSDINLAMIAYRWTRHLHALFSTPITDDILKLMKEYYKCKEIQINVTIQDRNPVCQGIRYSGKPRPVPTKVTGHNNFTIPDCQTLSAISQYYGQQSVRNVNSMGVGSGTSVSVSFEPYLEPQYTLKKKNDAVFQQQCLNINRHYNQFNNVVPPPPFHNNNVNTVHINNIQQVNKPKMTLNRMLPLYQHKHIEMVYYIQATVSKTHYLAGVP